MSDERLKKPVGDDKESRAMQDRPVTESRIATDPQRLEAFLGMFNQEVLPNLPDIPGYHVMWATTSTDKGDTINARLRAGYELVTEADVPGWSFSSQKTGEHPGAIAVNEMIALKVPQDLYEYAMKVYHGDKPRAEEERLQSVYDVIRNDARSRGIKVIEGDGFKGS